MQLILTLLVWQSNPMVFRGLLGFCIVPPMWLRKHNLLWHGEPGAKTLELFVCVNHSLQPNPTLLHDVLWEVYEKPWHWGNSPLSNTCSRHLTVCVFTFEKRKIRWELESVYCKGGKRSNWNLLDWRFRVFFTRSPLPISLYCCPESITSHSWQSSSMKREVVDRRWKSASLKHVLFQWEFWDVLCSDQGDRKHKDFLK